MVRKTEDSGKMLKLKYSKLFNMGFVYLTFKRCVYNSLKIPSLYISTKLMQVVFYTSMSKK